MNATLVIFGASGDLTARKLIPAIFHQRATLGDRFRVVGMARSEYTDDAWRDHLYEKIRPFVPDLDVGEWRDFARRIFYVAGSVESADDLRRLRTRLDEIEPPPSIADDTPPRSRVFYLATAPTLYATAAQRLAATGMFDGGGGDGGVVGSRLVLEKPFGTDLDSARRLNAALHEVLDESRIFRIDHYLGKETVQNLLVLWFANEFFEPLRHRDHIASVEITAMEQVGVEHRGAYYDHAGVVRDMVQNHLMQLLALTATEAPARADADSIRDEKVKLLRSIRPLDADTLRRDSLLGQYRGYRTEPDVAPDSRTPTFAAARFMIENRRWYGVPFFVRSGKSAGCATTQIVLRLRRSPMRWMESACPSDGCDTNRLVIQIQPAEGVHLEFTARQPGPGMKLRHAVQSFRFAASIPDAYQRLLLDALAGDASLFIRADEAETAWNVLDPLVRAHESGELPLHEYDPGSWGPEASDAWIATHHAAWYDHCPLLGH